MVAPLNLTTRTRYLVAEIVVVLFVAVFLGMAYRFDPQWISRHVILLNLWPPRDAKAWSTGGRGLLVLLAALVVLGLRPALMFVASRLSLAGLMRATVPALLTIAASALIAEAMVGWTREQALKGLALYQKKGHRHPRYGWTWQPSSALIDGALGRDIHWAFNREGDRVENENDEPDPTRPRRRGSPGIRL